MSLIGVIRVRAISKDHYRNKKPRDLIDMIFVRALRILGQKKRGNTRTDRKDRKLKKKKKDNKTEKRGRKYKD